jgi:starch-binding outer membrane protein, SusD/RagB family
MDDYAGMFNASRNNNHDESIFAIQHQLAGNPWGTGNQKQCDRGPGNLATPEASMWELYTPTVDIVDAYESGDTRRKGSIMEHGWTFPSWKPTKTGNTAYNSFMANGYVYDTLRAWADGGQYSETRANIAKFVVGPGASFGSETVLGMNTGLNTQLLRYADILLIYAEAVLGSSASTTDVDALKYFNMVRARAGLLPKTSLTIDDILHERRVEFAFEGDYWFDVQRQGFTKAKAMILAQNRGTRAIPKYITITPDMLFLPIPAAEVAQDPELAKPPVPYY